MLFHTRAMHLYQHEMNLSLISQWLGHANIETTLVYAHADTEEKRKAIKKAMADNDVEHTADEKFTINEEDVLNRLYGLQ